MFVSIYSVFLLLFYKEHDLSNSIEDIEDFSKNVFKSFSYFSFPLSLRIMSISFNLQFYSIICLYYFSFYLTSKKVKSSQMTICQVKKHVASPLTLFAVLHWLNLSRKAGWCSVWFSALAPLLSWPSSSEASTDQRDHSLFSVPSSLVLWMHMIGENLDWQAWAETNAICIPITVHISLLVKPVFQNALYTLGSTYFRILVVSLWMKNDRNNWVMYSEYELKF